MPSNVKKPWAKPKATNRRVCYSIFSLLHWWFSLFTCANGDKSHWNAIISQVWAKLHEE